MKKILLTGSQGFIGSYICNELLNNGYEVIGVDNYQKYGVDLDRTDLSLIEWIEHAKQEHMDAILYLEKIKNELDGQEKIY